MGITLAGFKTSSVIEFNKWACDTIRENQERDHPLVRDWQVKERDVRGYPFHLLKDRVDLLAGGPPCQPFSMGGKHKAQLDNRDMFPAMIGAIRSALPKAFIVENVKGLNREAFSNYREYIKLQLEFPLVEKCRNESWLEHLERLERHKTRGERNGGTYEVVLRLLNAAHYGVPQKRERLFFVGIRHDLHTDWSFPQETHSLEALHYSQFISGEYWDRHEVPRAQRPAVPVSLRGKIDRLRVDSPCERPWVTVRDALQGLPDPRRREGRDYLNHKYQPGAKTYPGHTGSPIDLPAKTLKAGVHGVPGGENMMVNPDGSVRYFTVREAARLQTFPDSYVLHGVWSEAMRQLGNAVPVALGRTVASSVACAILTAEEMNLREQLAREEPLQ